jgi:type IV pilus assembly protein PilV
MTRHLPYHTRGFTLLEVLVALVIISIGVIGIAAMQATALAGTHTSQAESIVALEARSLADAMLANPAYWASTNVPPSEIDITWTGTTNPTPSINNSALSTGTACNSGTPCVSSDMAGYDLTQWAGELIQQVPSATKVAINCVIATTTVPAACTIQVNWTQKATAAINGGTQSNTTATNMSYTLVNQF